MTVKTLACARGYFDPIDEARAIRFGGFSTPGYSDGSADVAILEVKEGEDYPYPVGTQG